MDLITFTAGAATFLATLQLVPQLHRVRSFDSVAGLSAMWTVVGTVLNLGWIGYRWSQELWIGLVSPVVATTLYLTLCIMIVGARRKNRLAIAVSTVAFGGVVVSAVLGGWIAAGLLLGAGSAVHIWPSVWAAFRSPDPKAVSMSMWAIGFGQAVLWAVYGWGSGDSIHLLYGLATAPGAAAIVGRCLYTRSRVRATTEVAAGLAAG